MAVVRKKVKCAPGRPPPRGRTTAGRASMWRRALLAAAAAGSGVGQQNAGAQTDDCAGACACVDNMQSNGWHDEGTGQDQLSLLVRVPTWQSGMHITASWPGFITIDDAYGQISVVDGAQGGGHDVTVQLSGSRSGSDATYVLMGHGTAGMPTSFSCTSAPNRTRSALSPRSSSSAAVDCDLGARWLVTNPHPNPTDAKVGPFGEPM